MHRLGGTDAVALPDTIKLDGEKIVATKNLASEGLHRPLCALAVHGAVITVE